MTVVEKVQSKVPQLRFPEFSGEWKVERVSSLATSMVPGRNKPKEFDGDIPWITIPDIRNRTHVSKSMAGLCLSEAEVASIGLKIVPKNAVVMSCVGELGFSSITKERVVLNQQLHAYIPGDNIDTYFLKLAIETNRKYLYRFATKTSVLYLNQDNCNGLPVSYPEKVEQKKIASFLSTTDKKTSLLKQKHEQLVQYKKGIMQQLFSQQLRFKDDEGQGFPDWHVKKLGKITSKTGKKNKDGTSYPVYSINNKEGFLPQSDQFEGMNSEERGFDISMYKIVEKNTFAYNPSRINIGSIGFSGELENIIVSSLYVCFQTKSELSDRYLMAYLDTYDFNKSVLRNAEGGVRQYLFYENFCNIRIPLPGLDEQNKIADFLDSIDQKINLVQLQIEQTQAYKQGLLQQMFV